MKRAKTLILLAAPAAFLMFAWGCGDGAPAVSSSNEEVQVKGTVTLKGKPLAKGKIQFETGNINRPDGPNFTYETDEDGGYSGKSLIGENMVTILPPASHKGEFPMNHKEVVLKAGENSVDIDVDSALQPVSK